MTLLRKVLPTAALLLALAGCDEVPTSVVRYVHSVGSLDFLIDATRDKGALLLEISGSPYAESGGSFTGRITSVLDRSLQIRPFPVTLLPDDANDPRYRLRLVFNGDPNQQVMDRCKGEAGGGGPQADGKVMLLATFCRDEEVLSAVDGWVEGTENSEDERFAKLLLQMQRELFVKDFNKP